MKGTMADLGLLRHISVRLNTPIKDIHHEASCLAPIILSHPGMFQSTKERNQDQAQLIHKIRSRVSALLQDRSLSAKVAATILIRPIIESGGYEQLAVSESWVRGLVSNLNKNNDSSITKLELATITKLMLLTRDYPELVREITTPILPSFLTTCLSLINPSTTAGSAQRVPSPHLSGVLQSWCTLLPRFSTTFRPFVLRLRPICLSILSDSRNSTTLRDRTSELLASLYLCAPKNTVAHEWRRLCIDSLKACHQTADLFFRGINEEWASNDSTLYEHLENRDFAHNIELPKSDVLGLDSWQGVHNGSVRLTTLLRLLGQVLSNVQSSETSIPIPIGSVLDLIGRLLAVNVPENSTSRPFTTHRNMERNELNSVLANLPDIHIECFRLLEKLFEVHGKVLLPVLPTITGLVLEVATAEARNGLVRLASYELLKTLISTDVVWIESCNKKHFASIVKGCCEDASSTQHQLTTSSSQTKPFGTNINLNGSSKQPLSASPATISRYDSIPGMATSARILIRTLLTSVPDSSLSELRTQLDRTSIFAGDKKAMLASVLNPPNPHDPKRNTPSILPFLARVAPGDLETESLLRPRMPVTRVVQRSADLTMDGKVKQRDERVETQDETREETSAPTGDAEMDVLPEAPEARDTSRSAISTALQQSLLQSPRKRGFGAMNDGDPEASATSGSVIEDSSKKSRTDMTSYAIESSTSMPQETSTSQISAADTEEDVEMAEQEATVEEEVEEAFAQALSPAPATTSAPLQGTESAPGSTLSAASRLNPLADSDESDFEIPAIDLTLDTDEEEENDDGGDVADGEEH